MAKILFISYYWPPSGGPGVQRGVKLVKYLHRLGQEVFVVAPHENHASYPAYDEEMQQDIPEGVKVVKTKSFEVLDFYKKTLGKGSIPAPSFANESKPTLGQKLARFIRGNFFIPDVRRGWNRYAFNAAAQLIKEHQIDYLITTGPPHSTHLIGLELKKKNNIKWLADFRDPWTDMFWYAELMQTKPARQLDAYYERKVLKKADFKVAATHYNMQLFQQKLSPDERHHFHMIPNGYDEDDFQNLSNTFPKDKWVITYAGTLSGNYAPEAVFEAIAALPEKVKNKICLQFVGAIAPEVKELLEKYQLQENAAFTGYVSHKEVLAFLMKACLLWIIIPEHANEKGMVPGKLYEYLRTQKYILNLGPKDGLTADFIKHAGLGESFERTDRKAIQGYLLQLFEVWEKTGENRPIAVNDSFVEQFSRAHTTQKVLSILTAP